MLLTLASLAFAAPDADTARPMPFRVDVHVAGVVLDDSAYGQLNSSGMTTFGVRAGYAVLPWLVPFVGASFNGAGLTHNFDTSRLQSAYYQDQFFGGAKAQWSPNRYFGVYGLAQGQAVYGLLRLDDDPDADDNAGQVEADGATGGVTGALGLEASAPVKRDLFAITFHLECGYAWNAPLHLGDVATLDPQGVFLRTGIGAAF